MSRYSHYSGYSRSRSSWGYAGKPTKYDELHRLIGSAVGEIKKEFFLIGPEARDSLFTKYGLEYGARAEAYARNTFGKWKTGNTALSGQTMERLIQLVPPYLSSEKRYALLQIIVDVSSKPLGYTPDRVVRIDTESPHVGISEVRQALSEMKVTAPLAHVSNNVMEAANWLYDDDITVARAMLVQIAALHYDSIRKSAYRDLELIFDSITAGQIKTATYRVPAPSCTIVVQIFTPKKGFWQNLLG
jgi:hypothetical protein